MERREFLHVVSGATTAGMAVVAGCTDGGDGGQEPEQTTTRTKDETTTTGTGGTKTVQMITESGDYYFDPVGLFVSAGETVTFTNKTGSHSSTAYENGTGPATVTRIPEEAKPWNSGTLRKQGKSFEHTFTVTGTYDYFCIPHKSLGMVGRIVVGKPGGPAEGSMPPDGTVPKSKLIVENDTVPWSEKYGQ